MSSPKEHIDKLLMEIHEVNRDHATNGATYVATKDIEIGIYKLQKAFEEKNSMKEKKNGLAK